MIALIVRAIRCCLAAITHPIANKTITPTTSRNSLGWASLVTLSSHRPTYIKRSTVGPTMSRILGPSCGHPGPHWATMGPAWGQERHPENHVASPEGHIEQPITCQPRSWIQSRTNHVYFEGALGSKSPCDHARAPSKTPLQHSYVPFWAYLASSWLHLGPSGAQCVASLGHLGPSGTPSCALSDLMSPPVTRQ